MIKAHLDTDELSVKLGVIFSKFGLSPNAWTMMALIPALLGFHALYYGNLMNALILFFISGAIDAIDGAVARVTGAVSEMGAFLDGVIDRYVEILLYIGLLFYLSYIPVTFILPSSVWIALLIHGALMPSFIRAYADHRKVVTEGEDHKKMGGVLERAERMTLLFIGMLLGYYNIVWLLYMIASTAVLGNITAFQRIYYVISYGKKK